MRCDNFYDCIDLTDELNCSGSFRMSVDGWIFYVDKQKLWVPFFYFFARLHVFFSLYLSIGYCYLVIDPLYSFPQNADQTSSSAVQANALNPLSVATGSSIARIEAMKTAVVKIESYFIFVNNHLFLLREWKIF